MNPPAPASPHRCGGRGPTPSRSRPVRRPSRSSVASSWSPVRSPYEVVLLYPEKDADERSARIERIRRAYEDRYQQDSVGRSDDRLTADF
ncbi:DUF3574 domain-containing protein [Streptomyces sp. NPDC006430]|uniref:DUF3574 domain-containing protein n=1 Tax=Streptomyces sp. NPDC006430 TaxID=3154299 RepID=UPI0033A61AC2